MRRDVARLAGDVGPGAGRPSARRPLTGGGNAAKIHPMRYLGVDLGRARVGLALGDDVLRTARAHRTLRRTGLARDLAAIARVASDFEVSRVVLGLPLNMDGTEGPRCQSIRQFAANIAAHAPPALASLPVVLQDERMSTAAVTRGMIDDYDMSRAKRAERVDAAAAAWILESALARLR